MGRRAASRNEEMAHMVNSSLYQKHTKKQKNHQPFIFVFVFKPILHFCSASSVFFQAVLTILLVWLSCFTSPVFVKCHVLVVKFNYFFFVFLMGSVHGG